MQNRFHDAQRGESPASLGRSIPYEDSGSEDHMDMSDRFSTNASTPGSDVGDNQPSSPAEDFRQYSQLIQKLTKIMELQVQLLNTDDSCKFFDHLNKSRAPPLCMGFIPSLLQRSKEAWNKPSSNPLILRRIDNMYKTQALNYLCAMEAYMWHTLLKFVLLFDFLPDEQKTKILSYHAEVMSFLDYQIITSCHIVDTAAKHITTTIHLRRHAWLCTATITDNARNRIENSPFDGEGLFAPTTDEALDNILKMRKTASLYAYHGTSSQTSNHQQSQQWHRSYPTNQQRPYNQYKQ
ncbi:hypothetical protein JRQ81_018775, partial [Phrynocephalus forsythii]